MLLPVKAGTKAALLCGWQELCLLDTSTPEYRELLREAATIAVFLGPQSGNLIGIDLDRDEAAREFLALNPALADTLRTRGARGCVLWIIIAGPYPARVIPFKDGSGAAIGEWRAGSGYSIISGQYPGGGQYSVLVTGSPLVVTFESINWPPHWGNCPVVDEATAGLPLEKVSNDRERGRCPNTIQKTVSSIGYPKTGTGGPKTARVPLHPANEQQLFALYERYVEDHWTPQKAQRNAFIVKAVPFLFNAMSEAAVMAVAMRFYDLNHSLFKDSRATHQKEAEAHLANVALRYLTTLSSRERRMYDSLTTARKKAAFRICRASFSSVMQISLYACNSMEREQAS